MSSIFLPVRYSVYPSGMADVRIYGIRDRVFLLYHCKHCSSFHIYTDRGCHHRISWGLDGILSRWLLLRVKGIELTVGHAYVWSPPQALGAGTLGSQTGMTGFQLQVWEEVEMHTK